MKKFLVILMLLFSVTASKPQDLNCMAYQMFKDELKKSNVKILGYGKSVIEELPNSVVFYMSGQEAIVTVSFNSDRACIVGIVSEFKYMEFNVGSK